MLLSLAYEEKTLSNNCQAAFILNTCIIWIEVYELGNSSGIIPFFNETIFH